MKEITMITTCEITTIVKVADEPCPPKSEDLERLIKKYLGADDVKVLNSQVFVQDKSEVVVETP